MVMYLPQMERLKVPLSSFNPERAIKLWWNDTTRRPNQHKRKVYKKQHHDQTKNKVIILDSDTDHSDVGDQDSGDSESSLSDDDTLLEWDRLIESA